MRKNKAEREQIKMIRHLQFVDGYYATWTPNIGTKSGNKKKEFCVCVMITEKIKFLLYWPKEEHKFNFSCIG